MKMNIFEYIVILMLRSDFIYGYGNSNVMEINYNINAEKVDFCLTNAMIF